MLANIWKTIFVLTTVICFTCQVHGFSVFGSPKIEQFDNSSDSSLLPTGKITPGLISGIYAAIFSSNRDDSTNICNCSCGDVYKDIDLRIVGGQETIPYEYPWMAQLSYFGRFYCGGTLINQRFVLTAAHCTNRFFRFMIKVTLGNHNRCNSNAKKWSSFISWSVAPSFSYVPIFGQDIALLRLDNPAPMNQFIRPICLPETEGSQYIGVQGTVAGWGVIAEDGKTSCSLRDVNVPIMSNYDCFENTNYKNISDMLYTDYMMCAGLKEGGKDSCQGDSGGPLMVQRENNRYEIVGVVSWGRGCARPNYPGIYTRVTKHMDWIRQNAREGCFCRH